MFIYFFWKKAGKPEELSYKIVEDLEIKKNHQAVLIEIILKNSIAPS